MKNPRILFLLILVLSFIKVSGQPTTVFQGSHTGEVSVMRLNPDQTILASGGEDGKIILWDLNTRSVLQRLQKHDETVKTISFHPSRPLVATSDQNSVIIWDLKNGKKISEYLQSSSGLFEASFLIKNKDSLHNNVFSGALDGFQLFFTENSLLIGDPNIVKYYSYSLYEVDLESYSIKPLHSLPEDKYDQSIPVISIEKTNNKQAIIQSKVKNKRVLFLYDIEHHVITRKFKIGYSFSHFKVSPSLDKFSIFNDKEEKLDIYEISTGSLLSSENIQDEYTWLDDEHLWIKNHDLLQRYNLNSKSTDQVVSADFLVSEMIWVNRLTTLAYLSGKRELEGITLNQPLFFNPIAAQSDLSSANKYGFQSNRIYEFHFLSDSEILFESNNDQPQIYHWDITENILSKIGHDYALSGVDTERGYVFCKESFSVYPDYQWTPTSSIDSMIFFSNGYLVGLEEQHGISIFWEKLSTDSSSIFSIYDYINGDTISRLEIAGEFRYVPQAFYDPLTEHLAVISSVDNQVTGLSILDQNNQIIREIRGKGLNVMDFDGKRLIVNDRKSSYLINLSYPLIDLPLAGLDLKTGQAIFHPFRPWIFYAVSSYNFTGINCYDYNSGITIGGISTGDEEIFDDRISDLKISNDGKTLGILRNDNTFKTYSLEGMGSTKTIAEGAEAITSFKNSGNVLYLEQLNDSPILLNLVDFKVLKTRQPDIFGLPGIFFEEGNAIIYQLKNRILTKTSTDEGLNSLESISIPIDDSFRYNHISEVINNRYLICNWAKYPPNLRTYQSLGIYDLQEHKTLIDTADFYYDHYTVGSGGTLYIGTREHFLVWRPGSDKLEKHKLTSIFARAYLKVLKDMLYMRIENKIHIYNENNLTQPISTLSYPEKYPGSFKTYPISDKLLWYSSYSDTAQSFFLAQYDATNSSWNNKFHPIQDAVLDFGTSENGKYLLISLLDGSIQFRNIETGNLIFTILINNSGDFYIKDEKGNFHSSNPDFQPFKIINNQDVYSTNSSLFNHRPDIILNDLGYAEEEQIALFASAVEKRKYYSNEVIFTSWMPEFEITLSNDGSDNIMGISLNDIQDSVIAIKQKVNGNVFTQSFPMGTSEIQSKSILIPGENIIELSALNTNGNEYPAQQIHLTTPYQDKKGDLILIAISVSLYEDETKNLSFAVKDGQDLIEMFQQQTYNYNKIRSYSLYDHEVSSSAIRDLFQSINMKPNDKVIVFFSGHGLIGKNREFYFATHTTDFNQPEAQAISYGDIQKLMQLLPSQRRLLLIDACHSGLLDNESATESNEYQTDTLSLKRAEQFVRKGTLTKSTRKDLTLQSSFSLMNTMFSDFSFNTGIETITAASGDSWALESPKWQNGAFTFVLKEGLINMNADIDRDGSVSMSELKKYLFVEVSRLTNGAQVPTSRESNTYLDWKVWH